VHFTPIDSARNPTMAYEPPTPLPTRQNDQGLLQAFR
jgi:hypothetical protein